MLKVFFGRRQTMPKKQERDVWAEFRACGPAQQQAIQVHMDQNFNPNCHVDEAYFNKLLKEALDAEMPYFARKGPAGAVTENTLR